MGKRQTQKSGDLYADRLETADLLLEIGTEELPYQFIQPALADLARSAERMFKEQRLAHGAIRTFGTPRRLVLATEALATRQAPVVEEVMGPSRAVAFDASGRPTKAAIGFAGSQHVAVEDLEIRQIPRGEYVFAVKRDPGRPAMTVLTEMLPALITSLSFPKSMRWNASGVRFARPIRWLLALYGGRVVPVQIGGVSSGNRTYGHRFVGLSGRPEPRALQVKDLKSYFTVLERNGVIPDPDKRRTLILDQLAKLARTVRGTVHHDEDLLEQAVFTVEWPHAVLGSFNPQYLSVPQEVLMTAMKEHQGYFSLIGHDGRLLPAFISVTNMKLRDMRLIREGNERVLAARLADARFFFDEDRKIKLKDRVEQLKGVIFHQKLGSLYQKTERIVALATFLAERIGNHGLAAVCGRAAQLSKADLLTGMVGEFPTLQGIMGGEYAKHDGEPPEVCQAIREQYLPRSMEGDLPETLPGKILSLADRLDTIVAFFHVGVVPTGSEDPLGLRRHASAIVRLLVEGNLKLNLIEAVGQAKHLVKSQGFKAEGAVDPVEFIAERLRYYGRTAHNLREDVTEAVLNPVLKPESRSVFDPTDLLARMKALQAITARPEFDPLMVGFKRAHRFVEKEKWSREFIDPALFQHPSETELYKVLMEARERVPAAIAEGDYSAALGTLVRMKPAIDDFFVGVLVNTEDEQLRANRLSLLYAVDRLFLAFADFSRIAVQGT